MLGEAWTKFRGCPMEMAMAVAMAQFKKYDAENGKYYNLISI